MTSRDTSEARIPSVPIVMPSETAIVLNSTGVPPACADPVFDLLGQSAQVHVARRDLGPRVGDADERLFEVGVGVTGAFEHGAAGAREVPFFRGRFASVRLVSSNGSGYGQKKTPAPFPGCGGRSCGGSASARRPAPGANECEEADEARGYETKHPRVEHAAGRARRERVGGDAARCHLELKLTPVARRVKRSWRTNDATGHTDHGYSPLISALTRSRLRCVMVRRMRRPHVRGRPAGRATRHPDDALEDREPRLHRRPPAPSPEGSRAAHPPARVPRRAARRD